MPDVGERVQPLRSVRWAVVLSVGGLLPVAFSMLLFICKISRPGASWLLLSTLT